MDPALTRILFGSIKWIYSRTQVKNEVYGLDPSQVFFGFFLWGFGDPFYIDAHRIKDYNDSGLTSDLYNLIQFEWL